MMDASTIERHPDFSSSTAPYNARRVLRRDDFATRVATICERFTRATGWPLSLHRVGDLVASAVADELRLDTNCRWFGSIGKKGHVAGFLRLDNHRSMQPMMPFREVRELATIICEFIGQTVASFDEVDDRTSDVMTILELTGAIPDAKDVTSLLDQILRAAINLTGCFSSAFFLLSPETDRLLLRQYCGPSLGSIPFACRDLREIPPDLKALQSGMATIYRGRGNELNSWLPDQANVGICHRVESATGPIGTLWLFDRRSLELSEIEHRVIESLSNQTAMALERSVLKKESKEAGRLQREMVLASESQEVMRHVSNHDHRGIEVASASAACDVVGGDLMEVIPVRDQVVFAIGDATGHSIPAAMIMSTVRGSLRALLKDGLFAVNRPDRIIAHINSTYADYASTGFYMSMFLGVIDTKSRILRYSNAGHPGPVLIRNGVGKPQQTHGLLLGIEPNAKYGMTAVSMRKGDVLVSYTDGVTEAMNAERKMLGTAGLQEILEGCDTSSADRVVEQVLLKLEDHCQGQYNDDHSLLVLKTSL